MKSRICFFSETPAPVNWLTGLATNRGGAEKQIAHLMQALAARGHQVYLLYGGDDEKSEPYTVGDIRCIPVKLGWRRWWSLATIWRQLASIQPDLIYARLPHDFLFLLGLYAKTHANTRFVYALANDSFCNPWRAYAYNAWFHNTLYAAGLRLADYVLVQHEGQRTLVQPYVKAHIVNLPNLLEPIAPVMREYTHTKFDAIWIGHLRPAKRLTLYLDLVERVQSLRFAIVGDFDIDMGTQAREAILERINHLPNLRYLGLLKLPETMQALAQSKVLVNTSLHEGFPNTMLEAWGLGIPVVSLNVDPGNVIVKHSLGRVSGDTDRLSRDVQELAESYPLNLELGLNGRGYVQAHHTLDVVCNAFEELVDTPKSFPETLSPRTH